MKSINLPCLLGACVLLLSATFASAQTPPPIRLFPQWVSESRFSSVQFIEIGNFDGDYDENVALAYNEGGAVVLVVLELRRGRLEIVYKRLISGDAVTALAVGNSDRDNRQEIMIGVRTGTGGSVTIFEHDGVTGSDNFLSVGRLDLGSYEAADINVLNGNRNNEPEIVVARNYLSGSGGRLEYYEHTGPLGINTYTTLPSSFSTPQKILGAAVGDTNRDNGGASDDLVYITGSISNPTPVALIAYKIDGSQVGPQSPLPLPLTINGLYASAVEVADIDGSFAPEIVVFARRDSVNVDAVVFQHISGTSYNTQVFPLTTFSGQYVTSIAIDKRSAFDPRSISFPQSLIAIGTSTGRLLLYRYRDLQINQPVYDSGTSFGTMINDVAIQEPKRGREDFDRDALLDVFIAKIDNIDHLMYLEQQSLNSLSGSLLQNGGRWIMQISKVDFAGYSYRCAVAASVNYQGYPVSREIMEGVLYLNPSDPLFWCTFVTCGPPFVQNFFGTLDSQGLSGQIVLEIPQGIPQNQWPINRNLYAQCALSSARGVEAFTNYIGVTIV